MQVTETLAEGLKRQFKVAVPAADVAGHVEAKLADVQKTVKLPGFRPGKVPLSLVRQRFLPSIMGEVLEAAVNDASVKLLADKGLRPALQPKVEVKNFGAEEGLEFEMTVEILPEITPVDMSKLELERPTATVGDAEIEKALDRLKEGYKQTKPVAKARAAKTGDTAVINFLGKVDGVAFEGGAGEGFHLELGSGTFIPGFEEGVTGMKPGAEKDVEVTFPENYGAANLAGKAAVFTVTLTELREKAPVEVDETFLKAFGMETEEALREALKGQVEREFAVAARQKVKRVLLDKLDETHSFDVPPTLAEAEFKSIWAQYEASKQAGEEDPALAGKSEDEVKAEYQRIADRRVRLGLLLAEVGRAQTVEVTEQEVRMAIFDVARRYPGQERQVIEFYSKNPDAMASLRAPIFEDKVVDYILGVAKITDKTVSAEELFEAEAA